MANKSDNRALAIHEAGHAVACEQQSTVGGMEVDFVTIDPTDGYAGTCYYVEHYRAPTGLLDSWGGWDRHDEPHAQGLISCAGYAAVIVAGYPEEVALRGSVTDFSHVRAVDLDYFKRWAIRMMEQPANRLAVMTIADELQRLRTLQGAQVRELLSSACRPRVLR